MHASINEIPRPPRPGIAPHLPSSPKATEASTATQPYVTHPAHTNAGESLAPPADTYTAPKTAPFERAPLRIGALSVKAIDGHPFRKGEPAGSTPPNATVEPRHPAASDGPNIPPMPPKTPETAQEADDNRQGLEQFNGHKPEPYEALIAHAIVAAGRSRAATHWTHYRHTLPDGQAALCLTGEKDGQLVDIVLSDEDMLIQTKPLALPPDGQSPYAPTPATPYKYQPTDNGALPELKRETAVDDGGNTLPLPLLADTQGIPSDVPISAITQTVGANEADYLRDVLVGARPTEYSIDQLRAVQTWRASTGKQVRDIDACQAGTTLSAIVADRLSELGAPYGSHSPRPMRALSEKIEDISYLPGHKPGDEADIHVTVGTEHGAATIGNPRFNPKVAGEHLLLDTYAGAPSDDLPTSFIHIRSISPPDAASAAYYRAYLAKHVPDISVRPDEPLHVQQETAVRVVNGKVVVMDATSVHTASGHYIIDKPRGTPGDMLDVTLFDLFARAPRYASQEQEWRNRYNNR